MSTPPESTAKSVLTDEHKLPLSAFTGSLDAIVDAVFTRARALGVRVRLSITHPGTILNDGTGVPYMDLSEKASNQGSFQGQWAMDPAEPVQWPDPLSRP